MLTLCTIPRAFHGHIGVIQRNAIRSWVRLSPSVEILIFGDEEGIPEIASEVGARVLPIRHNSYGTPLLSDLFENARLEAKQELICYVNTDIVLLPDLLPAVEQTVRKFQDFLMIGRRWNLDVTEDLDFDNSWQDRLRKLALEKGQLFGLEGVDYFVFPRRIDFAFPPFAVGRPGWDNWFLYKARSLRIPVLDATRSVMAVHQNHDYRHVAQRVGSGNEGPEGDHNYKLAGGDAYIFGLQDATHKFEDGKIRRNLSRERLSLLRFRLPVLYPSLMPLILVARSFLNFLRRIGLIRAVPAEKPPVQKN